MNRFRLKLIETLCLGGLAGLWATTVLAGQSVDERRSADPATQLELTVVAGKVTVQGWNRPEIEVKGTLGGETERLELTSTGNHAVLRVSSKKLGFHWGTGRTELTVYMPQAGSLDAHVTSADLQVSGISGSQSLQSVSGDLITTLSGEGRIRSVSGDVRASAATGSRLLQVSTVSGSAELAAAANSELSFESVSGDLKVQAGALSRVLLKTVSGDLHGTLGLTAEGRLDAQSISGDVGLHFLGALPSGEYDLRSLSGELEVCDGRKGARSGFGPETRLALREGSGAARVRVETKSGDVTLCGH